MVSGRVTLAELLLVPSAGAAGYAQKEEEGNDISHAMFLRIPIGKKSALDVGET
jgi:hypothetical protein